MHEQINKSLNRPYPLFLAHRKGRIYFLWMIFIFVLLVNILQPLGIINWHEFHKPLVLADYIVVFFGTYALLYMNLSYFRRDYYKPDTWTIKKEFLVLLACLPLTAASTCAFACFSVPGFILNPSSLLQLQLCNGLLSGISIPVFGYFIDTRLNPATIARRRKRKENKASRLNLNEQQARSILQKLDKVMISEELYLFKKCSLQQVATRTGIPVHHISFAINTYSEYNFTDFINKYRVEYACRKLQSDPDPYQKWKLEAVGAKSGFGSKVVFYEAFKKFTGKTPAKYRTDLKKNKNPDK